MANYDNTGFYVTRFSKMVEEHYPGLCEFNYVGNQY